MPSYDAFDFDPRGWSPMRFHTTDTTSDIMRFLNTLVEDFREVAGLAGVQFAGGALSIEWLPAPHQPPSSLPTGKLAVYIFLLDGQCLKVGKVGPKSQARYTSQHYIPKSSVSNLARSIMSNRTELGMSDLAETEVGDWIKHNTSRVSFLLDAALGIPVLNLLEAFLQCRLKPRFEGFESQR